MLVDYVYIIYMYVYPCGLIVLPRRDHLFGPQVVCVCISAELEEAGHACQSLLKAPKSFGALLHCTSLSADMRGRL